MQNMAEEDYLMTNPMALAELHSYWASLAPSGQVPRRTDIDPGKLGDAIEDCMILERVAPGVARVRVAGQRLCDLSGFDLRGMPLSVLFTPPARAELTRGIERAFHGPSVVEIALKSHGGIAQPDMDGRLILLPLRDGFGRVTRCLGCLVASGRRGRGGRRFDIPAPAATRIEPVSHLALASHCETHRPDMKKAEDRPTLRLVVDNA